MNSAPRDISKKTFWLILCALILARIIVVLLLMHNIPYTNVKEGGWWFYHGGDEQCYFNLAKAISKGKLVPEIFPLGYPLFLSPFIYFSQANQIKDIVKPVFFIQAILFFSFAIVVIALLAQELFQSYKISALCAAIFTFHPQIFYLFFHQLGPYYPELGLTRGNMAFQSLSWLQIISDPLSAILVYFSFFLFLIIINRKTTPNAFLFLLGAVAGYSALVRVPNIFIVGIIVLGLLLKKGLKEAARVALIALLVFSLQLIYNQIYHGFFLRFGQQAFPTDYQNLFSPSSLNLGRWIDIFQRAYFYVPIIICFFPLFLTLIILGLKYFWEKDKTIAILLGLWFFSYFGFYTLFSLGGIQFRYFIPAIPPLIFIIIGSLLWVSQKLKTFTTPSLKE